MRKRSYTFEFHLIFNCQICRIILLYIKITRNVFPVNQFRLAHFGKRHSESPPLTQHGLLRLTTYKMKYNVLKKLKVGDLKFVLKFKISAIIRATVGIRVLNKTSEEYWFLIKFHLSRVGGNAAERDVNIMIEYFLIRFQIASR